MDFDIPASRVDAAFKEARDAASAYRADCINPPASFLPQSFGLEPGARGWPRLARRYIADATHREEFGDSTDEIRSIKRPHTGNRLLPGPPRAFDYKEVTKLYGGHSNIGWTAYANAKYLGLTDSLGNVTSIGYTG